MKSIVAAFLLIAFSSLGHSQQHNITVQPEGSDASEVTIAVDPTNHGHLLAGANIDNVYQSDDGGLTWSRKHLSSSVGVWGDPCLYIDDQGTCYYVHLSNPPAADGWWIDRIVISRSVSHGSVWSDGWQVGKRDSVAQQDKAWIVSDQSPSKRHGTLYLSWTEFDHYGSHKDADSSRIRFAYSEDYAETWSDPITISDIGGNCLDGDSTTEGAIPTVDTNGKVFVVWADKRGIILDKSATGNSFGVDRVLAPTQAGWDFPIGGVQRCNGLPYITTDFSNGPYRGSMYILWSDMQVGQKNIDVLMMRSTNNGATWTAPHVVNTDTSRRDHFFPAMAVDQTTGIIYVVYYDRRNTAWNATDVGLSRSTDGGATFTDTIISTSSFTPTAVAFIGDYIGIAAAGGAVWPIWTRMDSVGKSKITGLDSMRQSVLTSIIIDSAGIVRVQQTIELPLAPSLAQNYPNPFGGAARESNIRFNLPNAAHIVLTVHDIAGKLVSTLIDQSLPAGPHETRISADALAPGTYEYRLTAGEMVVTRKMSVAR